MQSEDQDSQMMMGFVEDEMTLKTILLLCDPIITINALVSCITGLEERFQPSIILTAISVTFSTNIKLCYHMNPLSMKHADAPESRSVWVCIVMDLPPLIMLGNKKQGVGFKNNVGSF
jgi:hypothetical protein